MIFQSLVTLFRNRPSYVCPARRNTLDEQGLHSWTSPDTPIRSKISEGILRHGVLCRGGNTPYPKWLAQPVVDLRELPIYIFMDLQSDPTYNRVRQSDGKGYFRVLLRSTGES